MPYAETAAGELFYTPKQGTKRSPVLVLVHGAGGNRLHWPPELRRLPDVAVYTLDLPDHGRSEGQGCETIQAYAEAVTDFLGAAGIEAAVVMGHSMGGAVAQRLALDYSNKLAGLVLVATGARLRVAPSILDGIREDFDRAVDLITRYAWAPEADPALKELGREALRDAGPDVLLGDFVACDRFDVMDRIEEIDSPTLVIGGTADQLTPLKYARFLAEHIPQARCVTIEDAGHMVMLERPREVARAVQSFVAKLP